MNSAVLMAVVTRNERISILRFSAIAFAFGEARGAYAGQETSVCSSSGTKPLRSVFSVIQRASMKCNR